MEHTSGNTQCPFCGSRDTLPIAYGFVTKISDDFVPGGCSVWLGQPHRSCQACHRRFEYPGNVFRGPRLRDPSWAIDLVRTLPDRDVYRAREALWDSPSSVDELRPGRPSDDAWIFDVVGTIEQICPDIRVAGDARAPEVVRHDGGLLRVRLWQPSGPLLVDVRPGGVRLALDPDRLEAHRHETFALVWQLAVTLAGRAGCVAFARFDDLPLDTSLAVDAAGQRHRDWL